MSQANYKQMAARGRLNVVRRGGGASGCTALVAVDSLPTKYKSKVKELFPDGAETRLKGWVLANYEEDQEARLFFHCQMQQGVTLTAQKIDEYVVNASVLNCCIKLYDRASAYKKLMGEKYDWDMMTKAVSILKEEYRHTLPESVYRFRQKVNDYRKYGYASLISGKFGNQNKRKVDLKLEKLILALWCLPNKPYGAQVLDLYDSFLAGELDVYVKDTGELLDPNDYLDAKGEPVKLSESTIRNILNKPSNKAVWDESQLSWSSFLHESMPHMHRHEGEYSLSQITMDDVDLTRKLKDTKLRVKAYYAYDVVSQCVIGASYSRTKDPQLVKECFRDMFRLIAKHGWGIPAGIEVENHLMTEYKYTLLQEGTVFSHVRYCAPLNSQEKYAEAMNGAKKRKVIHRNHVGIGRFYGKAQWRAESRKVSDASNDTYEDKEYFSFEELVADDRRDNWEWNHQLHPNQKKYKGMTRWDVLVARINPQLRPYDACTLARYIGERVDTSIRRNSTVRVAYEDWWLSKPEVLDSLAPNNYKVTAYYLPDEDGKPQDVFIFQGDRYIDHVERVETYNRVMAEQTDEDKKKFYHQQKKVKAFAKYIKERRVEAVGVMKAQPQPSDPDEEEIINNSNYNDNETEIIIEEQQGQAASPPPAQHERGVGDASFDAPDAAGEVPARDEGGTEHGPEQWRPQDSGSAPRADAPDRASAHHVCQDAHEAAPPLLGESGTQEGYSGVTGDERPPELEQIISLLEESDDESLIAADAIDDI